MLGVEAVIVSTPGLVAGEDVVAFVPGEGLAVDGDDDLGGEDEEEGEDGGDGPARKRRFVWNGLRAHTCVSA